MRTVSNIAAAVAILATATTGSSAQTSSGPAGGTEAAQGATAGAPQTRQTDSDREARDRAMRNAQKAGMREVRALDRAFVMQGVTPDGDLVFMIVNPPGALIGVGTPVGAAGGGSGEREFQAGEVHPGNPFGEIDTSAVIGVEEPEIGVFAASLSEEDLVEMKERCDVISGDPSTYGDDVTTLCNSFLKWWGQNR